MSFRAGDNYNNTFVSVRNRYTGHFGRLSWKKSLYLPVFESSGHLFHSLLSQCDFFSPDLWRLFEWNTEDVGSIIRLISGDWLWRVIIGWLGRGVTTGVISEVELKGILLEWWVLFPEGLECHIVGCWWLKPLSAQHSCFGPGGNAKKQASGVSLLTLLHYPATPLSSLSDLLFSFLSLLPFPFCLPHFPPLLLSGLINNKWSRSSIDPIPFVLAQQKVSNMSEDLKIALRCGVGRGRVCWVKGRGLFCLLWGDSS